MCLNIKSEEQLAYLLGSAFSKYANLVQNGATSPYKAFLDGAESVVVEVSFRHSVVTVEPYVSAVEPLVCDYSDPLMEAVEAEETVIESTLILDKDGEASAFEETVEIVENPPSFFEAEEEVVDRLVATELSKIPPPKPKRKRRKKTQE